MNSPTVSVAVTHAATGETMHISLLHLVAVLPVNAVYTRPGDAPGRANAVVLVSGSLYYAVTENVAGIEASVASAFAD